MGGPIFDIEKPILKLSLILLISLSLKLSSISLLISRLEESLKSFLLDSTSKRSKRIRSDKKVMLSLIASLLSKFSFVEDKLSIKKF